LGGAGHEDAIGVGYPVDLEIAAGEVDGADAIAQVVQYTSNHRGTGSSAAGEGSSGSAFPNKHFHVVATHHFNKLGISALRKNGVMLEF
jgi:hypothetical protein